MPNTVDIEGVGTVEFPDTMGPDQIKTAIERDILPKFKATESPAQKTDTASLQPVFALGSPGDEGIPDIAPYAKPAPWNQQLTETATAPHPLKGASAGEVIQASGVNEGFSPPRVTGPQVKAALGLPDTVAGQMAGMLNTSGALMNFGTSPVGLGALALGSTPMGAVLVTGAFAADTLRNVPNLARETKDALASGDPQRITEAILSDTVAAEVVLGAAKAGKNVVDAKIRAAVEETLRSDRRKSLAMTLQQAQQRRFAQQGLTEAAPEAGGTTPVDLLVTRERGGLLKPEQRAASEPLVTPEVTAPTMEEVTAGGGEAIGGKVSFTRQAEPPLPERTQVARASENLKQTAPATSAALAEQASVPAALPTAFDRAIVRLESLKVEQESGVYALGIPGMSRAVWNTGLDIAIQAIRAGQTIGNAIDSALVHFRENIKGKFDEKVLIAKLESALKPKSKPTPEPAAQPVKLPVRVRDMEVSIVEPKPVVSSAMAVAADPSLEILPQTTTSFKERAMKALSTGNRLEGWRGILPIPDLQAAKRLAVSLLATRELRPAKQITAATFDAIKGKADYAAKQASNKLAVLVRDKADREALTPIVQAGADLGTLQRHAAMVLASDKATPQEKAIYSRALERFETLKKYVPLINDIFEAQRIDEVNSGFNTEHLDNYISQLWDYDLMMGSDKPMVLDATGGRGSSRFFMKQREWPNYAAAISNAEEAYHPRTMDASDLLFARISAGQQMINRRLWVNSLKEIINPIDKLPMATDLVRKGRNITAPLGYVAMHPFPTEYIAINQYLEPLVSALTGKSLVPKFLSKPTAFIKHNTLALDTFHASRLMQKELSLTGKVSYNKGLAVNEYSDADLATAVKAGDITQEMADWARENRAIVEGGIAAGLNINNFSDAIYRKTVRLLPGVEAVNKWIFDKLSRGAMTESYVWAFERNQAMYPELTDHAIHVKTAREINTFFGNMMDQGFFKSKTFQDLMRIGFLAPQWVESMMRTELGSLGQGAKAIWSTGEQGAQAMGWRPNLTDAERATLESKGMSPDNFTRPARIGTLARGTGSGLAAYVLATQIINYFTTGHSTLENPDNHKMDAWIPDVMDHTKGYWFSPLSVFAEITHDMLRYGEKLPTNLDAAARIAQNKEAPLTRATVNTLLFGQDVGGRKLKTTWARVKVAARDAAPIPLFVKGAFAEYPGSRQRQMAGSLGIKVETVGKESMPTGASR